MVKKPAPKRNQTAVIMWRMLPHVKSSVQKLAKEQERSVNNFLAWLINWYETHR